jgi:serine/threonine-protein kinase HipA
VNQVLEVWLDVDFLPKQKIGELSNDRGQIRFAYDHAWLCQFEQSFAIDPMLPLTKGVFFPEPDQGNFGVYLDVSPDRWGQTLMRRRQALQAKDSGRSPRTLYAWDFLVGVQDVCRQGALRFLVPNSARFLADDALSAPPVTSLRELAAVAKELSQRTIGNVEGMRRWLALLLAPGASLGGARPKANFLELDQSLWIAKFPASEDVIDVGAWEGLSWWMARKCGIEMPEAKVLSLSKTGHHTFCVRRFDRQGRARKFYSSAMTVLNKNVSEGTSYLELAEFIVKHVDARYVTQDLEQLFRRVVFNVGSGNRDDHLRNHGFLLGAAGWRLAPAFDVNPNLHKGEHVLNLDEYDNRPSFETVLATYEHYRLTKERAQRIVAEIIEVIGAWRQLARKAQVSQAEIALLEGAFFSG